MQRKPQTIFAITNNGDNHATAYKEFGINKETQVDFSMLYQETQNTIVEPLSRFLLFSKYMGYNAVADNNPKQVKITDTISKKDGNNHYDTTGIKQSYAIRKGFDAAFRTNELQALETIQKSYVDWLIELEAQTRISERDIKFQDYLHIWVKTNNIVVLELSAYLRSQIVAAQTAHFNALPANLNAYTRIQFVDATGNTIYPEILGQQLCEQQINPNDIADTSDFVVHSTIFTGANPPLILGGMVAGIENWKLDGDTLWGTRTVNSSQDRNTLPGGGAYPWLTADDFLEKHLITLPELDCKNFVTDSYDNNNKKNGTCLLPLTEEFFKYFKVEDLQKKDFFEIRKSGDVYEVILRIQVKIGIDNKAIQAIDIVLTNGNDFDTWITNALDGITENSLIEQPLFFRPLADILKKLSYEVEQTNN